jgi:hypothetical protein
VAAALYLTRMYGGPSALSDLFSPGHVLDLLALLSAFLPGTLLIWIANRLSAEARRTDAGAPTGRAPPGDS